MDNSKPTPVREMAELLSKLFAAFIGVAYVSGYLIVTDHMESLGISGAGANILKAKYVWIGFLYLLPLLLVTALTAQLYLHPPKWIERISTAFPSNRNPNDSAAMYNWLVVLTVITIGSRMLFFDAGWRESTSSIFCFAMLALLCFQIVHKIELYQRRKLFEFGYSAGIAPPVHHHDAINHLLKCQATSQRTKFYLVLLLAFTFLLTVTFTLVTYLAGSDPYHPNWWVVKHADIFMFLTYCSTVLSLHMQLSTAFRRDSLFVDLGDASADESAKRVRWVTRSVMLLVLFPASILGFTHVVYPRIPVERGGGFYKTGSVVSICVRPLHTELLAGFDSDIPQKTFPLTFCPSGISLNDAIVLEEDNDNLYVASVFDRGVQNQTSGSVDEVCGISTWHEAVNSPRIISIGTASIIDIRDEDSVDHFCSSQTSRQRMVKLPPNSNGTP